MLHIKSLETTNMLMLWEFTQRPFNICTDAWWLINMFYLHLCKTKNYVLDRVKHRHSLVSSTLFTMHENKYQIREQFSCLLKTHAKPICLFINDNIRWDIIRTGSLFSHNLIEFFPRLIGSTRIIWVLLVLRLSLRFDKF